jgi:PAS domain S-box-containing protein
MCQLNNKTLLLVDDDIVIAAAEKTQLENIGYCVIHVLSGEGAVELILSSSTKIDLVLMDISLGGALNGAAAAREILKTVNIPIVFLSSHTDKETVDQIESITSYGYVVKNSGIAVLDASIKMAFKLFNAINNLIIKDHELDDNEKRFDLLAEQNHVFVWEIDANGTYTYASKSSGQVIGYRPDELVGKIKFYDICPEIERAKLIDGSFKIIANLERFSGFQNPILTKNGRIIWVSTSGVPVFNNDGTFRGYCGSDIDITQLKLTSDSMQLAHRQFAAILNALPDLLFEMDLDGCIYDFRSPRPEMLFLPPEKFIGKTVHEVLPPAAAAVIQNAINDAAQNGRHSGAVYTLDMPSGPRWFELSIASRRVVETAGPDDFRFIVLSRDITEHKRSSDIHCRIEQIYRAIFHDSPIAIEIFDSAGFLISVNSACLSLFGVENESELKKFVLFNDPNISEENITRLKNRESINYRIAFDFEKVKKLNLYPTSKSGIIWLDVSITPLQEPFSGFLVQILDITVRHLADEKIRNLLREKELILKEVHHRIKNNMSTVFGLLTLQADNCPDSPASGLLTDAAGRVQSMIVLYDKLYRGENSNAVSMNQYFPSLIHQISGFIQLKNSVKFNLQIDDILLSPDLLSPLGIIINELITNAIKHAFKGRGEGGIISISASGNESGVTLVFEDNGTGIPHDVTIENSQGFGLQLVEMLVRQIRGSVLIERNGGTKFIIKFKPN